MKTNEQYFRFPRQLLNSPAWSVLNINERRAFDRIMEEHQSKSGFVKDGLVVTTRDFVSADIHPRHVKSSLRVLAALGIIVCTRGMGGSANGRTPNMYAPTFLPRDPTKKDDSAHDYLEIKTLEEAKRRAELHRFHEKRRDRISLPRMRAQKHADIHNEPRTGRMPQLLILSAPLLGSPREFHPFFGDPHPLFFTARTDRPLCLLEAFLR
jgi:hypothetical protein